MDNSQKVQDWFSSVDRSSQEKYRMWWKSFVVFASKRRKDPEKLVEEYRAAKYEGERQKDVFLDDWIDVIKAYSTSLEKSEYAPLTRKNMLVTIRSFLSYWKIPLDIQMPKHACVIFHNRDFSREQLKMIITHASPREKAVYLFMVESGLRAGTTIVVKYWQIQDDFEKEIIPMRILTPSETLKDHVGDRWSFIGEDGFHALKEYLQPRMPLKPNDYVFLAERPNRVTGEQFGVSCLSVQFHRLVQKLNLAKGTQKGKPGHYRMHGLRKYFRNNMRADPSYREFWMGHSLGVDAHYISRNPEAHREEYRKGYPELRILEPLASDELRAIQEQLKKKDQQIQELSGKIEDLKQDSDTFRKMLNVLKHPERLKLFEQWISEEKSSPLS